MFGFVDQGAADAASAILRKALETRVSEEVIDRHRSNQQGIHCPPFAVRGDAKGVAEYVDANPNQLDNRTIFQSTLLHIAARNGRLQVALELLNRGIDVNALDYVCLTFHSPVDSSPHGSTALLSMQMPDTMLFRYVVAAARLAQQSGTDVGTVHM